MSVLAWLRKEREIKMDNTKDLVSYGIEDIKQAIIAAELFAIAEPDDYKIIAEAIFQLKLVLIGCVLEKTRLVLDANKCDREVKLLSHLLDLYRAAKETGVFENDM